MPGDWCRVENGVGPGTPDVNYCLGPGREGWLELKVSKKGLDPGRPGDTTIQCTLRPAQLAWLSRRRAAGGRVGVLWGLRDGTVVYIDRFEPLCPTVFYRICSIAVGWCPESEDRRAFLESVLGRK